VPLRIFSPQFVGREAELQALIAVLEHGLLDTAPIERLLARSNGRRGVKRLRALLDHDATEAARANSELERLFLALVRAHSLPSPALNAVVDGYEVDAYWPAADLIVELDGYEFHSGRSEFERDHEKLARLRLAGHDVLALTHRQVTRQADWVIAALRQMLAVSV
jgi:very-short-patch-repair endonuclease